ncbi:N-acetyl-gamma-glutamyl-phosphate reductase [Miltoncostaea marina]|uniref:N-acetyl-gamma-glutamyl-phosphate reductase n=1 Tax=Miltoncostaea marina TaxID=2843215 RepID=UPI001C3C4B13|nr:N-acetyl-gamma-glutamyl-phosphate reductase [Miltoncostaea marina]
MAPVVHVFGAAGFAGAQLAALVDRHPGLELGVITARGDAGRRLVEVAPEYRVDRLLEPPDVASVAAGDLVAVAYPHAEAAKLVAALIDRGARVVDVSADHRLHDATLYPQVYGFEHPRPDLLAEAVYGLPERHREAIRGARLVANPGCFPEASILALLPLAGEIADVVIDAKSGVSGAGRTPTDTVHYSRAADNVSPYKVYAHRHRPEMEQELGVEVTFTPHLVPVDRGLLATCYARLLGDAPHPDDLLERYRAFYAGHPFVEVVEQPPGMRAVQRTNYAQVHVALDPRGGRITAFGVLDNIGKGAAGQAVQNLNLMAGLPETEGLD